jgi:hypothetical protein
LPGRQRSADSFQLIVYAGRDPVSGKDRYVRKAFKGSKRAAQQALARLVTEVGDGEHVGTEASFAGLLERWYERSVADWSPATALAHPPSTPESSARRSASSTSPPGSVCLMPPSSRSAASTPLLPLWPAGCATAPEPSWLLEPRSS